MSKFHAALFPTTDFDRSRAFYESLGWTARLDLQMGDGAGERWLELEPPVGDVGIALIWVTDDPGRAAAIIAVEDLDATHADLLARGIDADPVIARPGSDEQITFGAVTVTGPSPDMFYVRDPDGNRLLHVAR